MSRKITNRCTWPILTLCFIMMVLLGIPFGKGDYAHSKSAPIVINFWHHYNAQSTENKILTTVIIPSFQKKNPGIIVKAVPYEWDQLHRKILISASSKQLPDIARSDIAWVPEFQKLNLLVPLNKEMKDFGRAKGELLEGPMNTGKIKGNYYGLALNTNTKILFYNKELFIKAGLMAPRTIDEFLTIARKLSGKKGEAPIWGYGEPALAGWNICPFIWSNGGDITDPGYKVSSGYLNAPASVEIIKKLAELYQDKAMAGFNKGDIPLTDGYAKGRYAMIIEGPWKFDELETSYPGFEAAIARMPAGKGGSAQVLGGEDIVMFVTAKKVAAWKFMKFMTSEFAQIEMAKAGQIPVNKKAIDSSTVRNLKNFAPFLEAIKTAKPRPPVAAWSEIDRTLTDAVTLAITGQQPVQKVLDEAARKIDILLKE